MFNCKSGKAQLQHLIENSILLWDTNAGLVRPCPQGSKQMNGSSITPVHLNTRQTPCDQVTIKMAHIFHPLHDYNITQGFRLPA